VFEIVGIVQLADLPDKLPAEIKNMVRLLYRLQSMRATRRCGLARPTTG
jgi:hypothetical protein